MVIGLMGMVTATNWVWTELVLVRASLVIITSLFACAKDSTNPPAFLKRLKYFQQAFEPE